MQETDAVNYAILIIKNHTSIDIGCITSAKRSDTDLYINIDSDVKVDIDLDAIHNTARITNRGEKCICVRNAFSKDGNKTLDSESPLDDSTLESIQSSLGASLYYGEGDLNSLSSIKDENEFEHLKTQHISLMGFVHEDGSERPLSFNYERFRQLQGKELLDEIVLMISAWETLVETYKVNTETSEASTEEKVSQQEHFMTYCDVLCQASILLNGEGSVTEWRAKGKSIAMQVLRKVE